MIFGKCIICQIKICVFYIFTHIRNRIIPGQINIIPFPVKFYLIPCMQISIRSPYHNITRNIQTGHQHKKCLCIAIADRLMGYKNTISIICILLFLWKAIYTVLYQIIMCCFLLIKIAHRFFNAGLVKFYI